MSQVGVKTQRRGVALLYVIVMLSLLLMFVSLAADYARVQLVKSELRLAADAAARAAADDLSNGASAARTAAVTIAGYNKADGTAVSLDATNDVEIGTWNTATRIFTPNGVAGANTLDAVRITARRTTARGNPVSLAFAGIMGRRTCDVSAVAVATASNYGYGMVGLTSITMSGNSTASYWSGGGSTGSRGSIASNGNITLSGSTYVNGDARPGPGKTVSGATGRVAGITTPLTTALSYPPGDGSAYVNNNNNANLPWILTGKGDIAMKNGDTLNIPGGTYYIHHMSVSANAAVSFAGPTTIYIWGDFTLSGSSSTYANIPGNLKIIQIADPGSGKIGKFNVSGSSSLVASIYAPQSTLNFSGSGAIYGSVVGSIINMSGSSDVYYDLALNPNGGITLVK